MMKAAPEFFPFIIHHSSFINPFHGTKESSMTLRRLLRRNLFGHWRGNLAVLLGVAVGTAVLTGALLVGDSLRGSLRDLTLRQLGWVDHVLISQHFIRQDLVDHLQAEHACPAILFQGSANRTSSDATGRTDLKSVPQVHVGRVTILGVTEQFWLEGQAPLGRDFWIRRSQRIWMSLR
jgi:hypothetical protein